MRRELHHRPLLLVAAALALGAAGHHEPLLLLTLIAIFFLARQRSVQVVVVLAALLGYLRAQVPATALTENRYVEGTLLVASVPMINTRGLSASVDIHGCRLKAYFAPDLDVSFGDQFQVRGLAKPFDPSVRTNYVNRGISGTLQPLNLQMISRGPGLLRWALRWRDSFRAFSHRWLPVSSSAMLDALCFNVSPQLDEQFLDDIKRTGTIHIISASGLHVLIFSTFLQALLALCPVRRSVQLSLVLVALIIYMVAAGLNPPIVRSVVMAAVLMAGSPLRRKGDLLSALGFAAIVTMLVSPSVIFEAGAQLSFAAVGGLGLFQRFETGIGLIAKTRRALWSSGVATASTAPLIAYHFGYVSTVSLAANLIVAPLASAMVVGSLGGWGLSFLSTFVSQFVVAILERACDLLTWAVHLFAIPRFASIDVPGFSPWLIPVYYLAMIGLWRRYDRPA